MEANEIMVGDWVKWKDDGECYRISEISEEIKGEATVCFVGHNYMVPLDEINHIPLTPVILEKNGFKKVQIHGEKQDDIFQCIDGEIIIEIGIYDPNFILIHYRQETPNGVNSGELSSIAKVDGGKFYLHELQHALRLCRIEKEIEL